MNREEFKKKYGFYTDYGTDILTFILIFKRTKEG